MAVEDEGRYVLLEFSGHPEGVNQGLDILGFRDKVALLGLPADVVQLHLAEQVILKGISLHGVFGRRIFETWYRATNLLQKIDITPVVTHSCALEDIDQALALMRSGECGKVVLSP